MTAEDRSWWLKRWEKDREKERDHEKSPQIGKPYG